ncbi:dTDP-4-dehydrorhamnose reductase [Neogemmobacter tilapiae]|uniref:dTDP-4-dehydrorhamnose reductase n=1 Tax=Neogemmobacter tilapiae TaxID=875041 RepID=A0A918TP18_9RHOB|nr:dTDP-4-dehydrorhamnose reductase [Gemmobacter tilapiae]GHC56235.1 NAD(P)-dependent oxidoreductase [Gemmobacter tilapiae]
MRILVIGKTGQVAQELQRASADVLTLGRDQADLSRPSTCAAAIKATDAQVVINAAAYTAVDRAETEPELAHMINATAPGTMAQVATERGLPFIHLSTDYVFDGSGDQPWQPDDSPAPLSAYGRSKWAGEQAVLAHGGTVIRTSWVFSAHGTNFVKTMLRLGAERETLNVVADQWGGPTPADALAQALLTVAKAPASGLFHFAGQPDTNWSGFARNVMARAGLACQIHDIPSTDYPTPAQRPLNSRLDCSGFTAQFGVQRPNWETGLDRVIHELRAQ